MFVEGRVSLFVLMVAVYGLAYLVSQWSKSGKTWNLRKLPAVDAIVEGIGRAVELGKPVHFSAGVDQGGPGNPARAAGYTVLKYVATNCAQRGARLITTVGKADVYAICDQIVKEAATVSGNPEWYKPEDVRFLGEDQWVYSAGMMELLAKEQVVTNYIFGYHRGSLIILLEAGRQNNCFQISGMAQEAGDLCFLAICSDYWLVLEEMVAIGAYLSGEPEQLGTVVTQDYVKIAIILGILIPGALLITAGIDIFQKLLML